VLGLLAVGLPALLVAQLAATRTLTRINDDVDRIREAQIAARDAIRLQLDEESGIRGYADLPQRILLAEYLSAKRLLPERLAVLQHRLAAGPHGTGAIRRSNELAQINVEWQRRIAAPILHDPRASDRLEITSKRLVDRYRDDIRFINRVLRVQLNAAVAERKAKIAHDSAVASTGIVLVAVEIAGLIAVITALRRALDRERAAVETLQDAAAGRIVAPAHLEIGTAYRSATQGAKIGGDLYDVFPIDACRTLLLVADVSGKGLTAAVDTTFVRYAVRALAREALGPATIVAHFDELYRAASPEPQAFVTLLAGIHDQESGTFTYANAGHEAAWIRRGSELELLAPTGPIVGIGGFPFSQRTTVLSSDDMLILATDGLTEAREPGGAIASSVLVAQWIRQADASTPQRLVDAIVASAASYARGQIGDDQAVLAVSPIVVPGIVCPPFSLVGAIAG
jgi:CHASE3 domain sensor protein